MLYKIKNYWKPLVAVFVWGLSFIATKNALKEIKPEVIILFRQLLGILFLGLLAIRQKRSFGINLKDFKWVFLLAVIACSHLWIQVTGLQWTSASNTGWIIGITPVFMTILGFLFFREKITRQQFVGIATSFMGLVLLVSKGILSSLDLITNKGDVLVIMSSFTWAVYSLVSKKATLNISPVMTTFYLFVMVAIVISPIAISRTNYEAVIHLSFTALLAVLFLGILCSGVAYTLWAQSLSEMSATRVGAFLYIEPFVTFFGSWLLLNEKLTLLMFVSGLIIIGGVILINRK